MWACGPLPASSRSIGVAKGSNAIRMDTSHSLALAREYGESRVSNCGANSTVPPVAGTALISNSDELVNDVKAKGIGSLISILRSIGSAIAACIVADKAHPVRPQAQPFG
ncbi:hypothetical protein E2562_015269 [Oryza meyeriana var. granulata]|uniref:Uncharacterized protein n=1 Tax=Oryza meyeriana var. granulata TaxID=110450 RepID=A0A6G1DJH4_9ORYZ|nr:hypothetical protein E2562_015269 [Oryza meyeriana var. granulata]